MAPITDTVGLINGKAQQGACNKSSVDRQPCHSRYKGTSLVDLGLLCTLFAHCCSVCRTRARGSLIASTAEAWPICAGLVLHSETDGGQQHSCLLTSQHVLVC